MNSNTFKSLSASYPSGHPFILPAAFTTTTTTETAFLLGNSTPAVVSLPTGTEIMGAQTPLSPNANASQTGDNVASWLSECRPFFNTGSFDNRPFKLRASGIIVGGLTTLTLVSASINIYAALTQATTVTSGTKIANVAITGGVGGASANWMLELTMQWDSVSQILAGSRSGFVSSLLTSGSVGTNLTAVTSLALTSINFGFTYVFATSSTANKVGLVELSLEQV